MQEPTPVGTFTTTFGYDAQGNRTSSTDPFGRTTYRWDQANRLTNVGAALRYVYNGDGLRARKVVGAVGFRYLWDTVTSDVPLLLSDTERIFIYGPGGRVIEQLDLVDLRATYLHRDQIGSIRLLTNDAGLPAGAADYDPFGGNEAGATVAATTPFGFAGEYTDAETGLVYLRARYYDPRTGVFLSRDPIEDLTESPYGYAENNPLNLVDPLGLCGWRDPWNCVDDIGKAAWRNRGTFATVGAIGGCLVPGVGTVACAGLTAGAYAVRAQQRAETYGGWGGDAMRHNLIDLAITGSVGLLVAVPGALAFRQLTDPVAGAGRGIMTGAPGWQQWFAKGMVASPDVAAMVYPC
jgi:RHS repeat-associated protein